MKILYYTENMEMCVLIGYNCPYDFGNYILLSIKKSARIC